MPSTLPGRPVVHRALASAATALALTGGLVVAVPSQGPDVWLVAVAVWCVLVLGSGVALIISWRVAGWARAGVLGAALAPLGLVGSVTPRVAELAAGPEAVREARMLAIAGLFAVALVQSWRAVRGGEVDTRARPLAQAALVTGIMVLVLFSSLAVVALAAGTWVVPVWIAPAVCWAGATALVLTGRGVPSVPRRAIAIGWALAGVASFVNGASKSWLAEVTSATVLVASASLFTTVGLGRLVIALTHRETRELHALESAARFSQQATVERERRHDALNAVAAIRSATEVLTSAGPHLDADTRRELRLATSLELLRVERILAADVRADPREVTVADELAPVVLIWSQRGVRVEVELDGAQVYVVPGVLTRIVDNLLQNVARHAPGATVRLSVDLPDAAAGQDHVGQGFAGMVRLNVRDDGPGVPDARRAALFDPTPQDQRGGHALGLVSSRRLAREQGGDLALHPTATGCWFVLSLPAAARSPHVRPDPGDVGPVPRPRAERR